MKHIKLVLNILTILTVILGCLAFYTYIESPTREEEVLACDICDAFRIEKVKDTSTAKKYVIASAVSGSLLICTLLYMHKSKKRRTKS